MVRDGLRSSSIVTSMATESGWTLWDQESGNSIAYGSLNDMVGAAVGIGQANPSISPKSIVLVPEPVECAICGDYTVKGSEVHAACLAERAKGIDAVVQIVRQHTHQGLYAMTRFASAAGTGAGTTTAEQDCLLCRALVAAGVLTLEGIGAGTRVALAEPAEPVTPGFVGQGGEAE